MDRALNNPAGRVSPWLLAFVVANGNYLMHGQAMHKAEMTIRLSDPKTLRCIYKKFFRLENPDRRP